MDLIRSVYKLTAHSKPRDILTGESILVFLEVKNPTLNLREVTL